jgi:hypothetical protein
MTHRIVLILSLFALTASAVPAKKETAKKTLVHFDGDTIDGTLQRPDGELVSSRPPLLLPSLVKPPSSFERASRTDLLEAADQVAKRTR